MRVVFADTGFWLAEINPRDQWASTAKRIVREMDPFQIVTTDEVLLEVLNSLSQTTYLRRAAIKQYYAIMDNPNILVLGQSRDSFLKGLALFEERADKSYSLTDCIAMSTMKELGIQEVLTNDRHFEQEGFVVLMKHPA